MTLLTCQGAHQVRHSAPVAGLVTWQTDYPGVTHAVCHASSWAHRHNLARRLATPSRGFTTPAAADLRAPVAAATRGGWGSRNSGGGAEAGSLDRPHTAGPRSGRPPPRPDSQPQPQRQPQLRLQVRQRAGDGGQNPRQQGSPDRTAAAGGTGTSGSDDDTHERRNTGVRTTTNASSNSPNGPNISGSSDFPGARPNGTTISNPGNGLNGFSGGAETTRTGASAGGSPRTPRNVNSVASLGGVSSIRRIGGMRSLGGVGGIGVGGADVAVVTARMWERMVRDSAEEARRSGGRGRDRGGQAGPRTKGKGRGGVSERALVDPVAAAREVFGQVVRRDVQQLDRWAMQPALVGAQGRRILSLDPFGLEAGGSGDGRGDAARVGDSEREGVAAGGGGGGAPTDRFLHDFRDEEDDSGERVEGGRPRYRFLVVMGPRGGGQEPQAPGGPTVEQGQGPEQGRQSAGLQNQAPSPPQPPLPSLPSSQRRQPQQQQIQNRGTQELSAQEPRNVSGRDTLAERSPPDAQEDPQQQQGQQGDTQPQLQQQQQQQQPQGKQSQGLQQGQQQGLQQGLQERPQQGLPQGSAPSTVGPQPAPRNSRGNVTKDDGRSGASLHEASAADTANRGRQAPGPVTAPSSPPSSPPSWLPSSPPVRQSASSSPSPSVVAALGASSVIQTAATSAAPPRQRYDYRLRLDPTKSVKLVAWALLQTLSRHSVVLSEVVGQDELYHGLKALATARTVLHQQQQQQPDHDSGQQQGSGRPQSQGQMQTDRRGGGGRRQTKQRQQQEQQQRQMSPPGVLTHQLEAADVALQLLIPKQPYIRPRFEGGRGRGGRDNYGEDGETGGGEGGKGASRVWRLYSHRVPAAAVAAVQLDPSARLFVSRTTSAHEVAEKLGPAVVRNGQVEVLVAGRDAAVTALAALVRTRAWLAAGGSRGAERGAGAVRAGAEVHAGGGPDEAPAPHAPSPSPPSQQSRQLSVAAGLAGTWHAREGFQHPSREQRLDPNFDLDVAVYASWRGGSAGGEEEEEEEEEEARNEPGVGQMRAAAAAAQSRPGPQWQSQPGWQPGPQLGSQSRGLRLLVRLCRGARPDLPVLGWDELVAPVGG